jgi:hypothetical protein
MSFISKEENMEQFMCSYNSDLVDRYLKEEGSFFHDDLFAYMDLNTLIDMKGPFFLSNTNTKSASAIVRELITDIFEINIERAINNWLKGLAIFINENVYHGKKSGIPGIDLEFDNDGIRYIVSIKSGPNWGNSSQIKKMKNDFTSAQKTLLTSNSKLNIRCINGCCYGKDKNVNKGSYYKYCGPVFWEFIGGNENIYLDIIEPLGHKAKERNEEYMEQYCQMINKFTKEFVNLFCDNDGVIDWEKLIKYNSGK